MENQKKYRAFISYSHADSRQAASIHRFLEGYSIPPRLVGQETEYGRIPRRLRPVFKDRDELPTAADLGAVVNDAMRASDHLIVVCSPHSAKSMWVNEEVLCYKRLGRADRILCIVVAGEPNASKIPGRESEECFCDALRFQLGQDGQLTDQPAQPVAADTRPGGDGARLARLKLVAGMLGVGLDELRQREMHRRHQRMAAITAASVVGMALTLMLAWAAVVARNDAEDRREQADDLIGFMLGDLRERLNEVGRLDVLDSVAVKALDYFAQLPAKDLNDEALASRAEALMQLGQVQLTRGRPDEAMSPLSESLHAVEELSRRDRANLDLLFKLGQAHFWVGYVHWEQNNLDAADSSMQQYFRLSERLYQAAPDNEKYILELGYSFSNLAILSDRRGDIRAALDYNQQAIDLSRTVHERDRENQSYQRALAEAYSWRGSMLRNDNQFAASSARFADYLQVAQEAGRAHPDDTQWMDHQMLAHRFVADSALDLGDTGAARNHYHAGLALAQKLDEIEPANNNWQIEHALLELRIAQMIIRDAKLDRGLHAIEAARSRVREHLASSPDSSNWLIIDVELDLLNGKALLGQNDLRSAAVIAGAIVSKARQMVAANPTSARSRALLVDGLILAERIAGQDKESPGKHPSRAEALAIIQELGKLRLNPDERSALIRACLDAGQLGGIAEMIESLRQAQYRHPDFVAAIHGHGIEY